MLFDEPPAQIQARLSRWVRQGHLLQLRRGKYLLGPEHRRREASEYYISNYLYRPSYVSLASALEYHGMIPEAVGVFEAVTTKRPKRWETPAGRFEYDTLARDRFWGFREYRSSNPAPVPLQSRFLLALPEKALIDLFYLNRGEWTETRIHEMRFQELESLNFANLFEWARRFGSPRVLRAVGRFSRLYRERATA